MSLQNEFIDYIKEPVALYHPQWRVRLTKRWLSCYSTLNDKSRVIIYIGKANKNGSFWVFITISFLEISKIEKLRSIQDRQDSRKHYVSIDGIDMAPIELLDRGIVAKSDWERLWPVGFKIVNNSQFNLALKIILKQWE